MDFSKITIESQVIMVCQDIVDSKEPVQIAYTVLVHPILKHGAVCWDQCWEGQKNVLDRSQK
jgi:hypothetical protein